MRIADGENKKVQTLLRRMAELAEQPVCLAFSGGVDSGLLLKLLADAGGAKNVYPVMMHTSLQPQRDEPEARRLAAECGLELTVLPVDLNSCRELWQNPPDRCYLCKKTMFAGLQQWAAERGISCLVEGTNADDRKVYRPGLQALAELGIQSPLAECGLTKAEVRTLAADLGLSVADRPSSPCMATRLPYGAFLDVALLGRLEQGEEWVRSQGIRQVRLRFQDPVLRIEVAPEEMDLFWQCRKDAVRQLKALGFFYIAMDLEGFRSGSMDEGKTTGCSPAAGSGAGDTNAIPLRV